MNNQNNSKLKKRVAALAVVSCLSFSPLLAEAAGLGKITVLSGLGQPLRAELEINASREEAIGMAARLAPVDAFKQAGIEYSNVLSDLRFALEKRADGRSVVKVSSSKPVNEPFLDFLVELNWSSGRLMREYTFLLDPPELAPKSSGRPLSVVEAKVVSSLPGGDQPLELAPVKPAARQAVNKSAVPAPAPVKSEAEESKVEMAGTHLTKTGDTLGKIAAANRPQGVSLEQMLVGLYQNNPDAFIGKNLNRLKSGAILNIPDKNAVEAIPEAEAKKIFLAQSGDWNAYRRKVAAAASSTPVKDFASNQQAAGNITAKVEEKPLPAEQTKDQVKVSRSELAANKAVKAADAADEERIAKDRALKEANERLGLLEKNVTELQKLLEMKNQRLAELQQKEQAKPVDSKPLEPVKEEAKAPEPKLPEPKVAEPVTPPEPVKVAEEVAKLPEAVKPPAAEPVLAPKPAPKPLLPPPPVDAEQDLMDALLADPMLPAGAGGIVVLLLSYLLYKRRRNATSPETTANSTISSSLGENSVFHTTGGQNVDTSHIAHHSGDFSQTGPGTIDTDEVDPVAEADVYMAYGRDAQAEEILLEALQKDPQRTAIHAKLLEIYANRMSLKQFDTLATELYAQTGGVGPEWDKVAVMGANLDPENPLYSVANRVVLPPSMFDAGETMVASPARDDARADAENISFELPAAAALESFGSDSEFTATVVKKATQLDQTPVPEMRFDADDLTGLDFDLGASLVNPPTAPIAPVEQPALEEFMAVDALEFDLAVAYEQPTPEPEPVQILELPSANAINADALGSLAVAVDPMAAFAADIPLAPTASSSEKSAGKDMLAQFGESATDDPDSLNFDMDLTRSIVLEQPAKPAAFDINTINLDLSSAADVAVADLTFEAPLAEPAPSLPEPLPVPAVDDPAREEISTKLDLAKAYEEMGDLEGARELLSEVAAEGPPDLSAEAKEILARIGG